MHDNGQCLGYEQLAFTTGAVVTPTVPGTIKYANAALLRGSADFRVRFDGVDPTTTTGMLIKASDTTPFWIEGQGLLENMRVIGTTGSGNVDILYFGAGE